MKVLLVEDNSLLVASLHTILKRDYIVDVAQTSAEALQQVDHDCDVVILDLGLPDIPGLVVCQRLRDLGFKMPILIITGDDRMTSRVQLLNSGADDYVIKPFHADEIRARLSALLRRPPLSLESERICCDDLTIDVQKRQVTRSGIEVQLRRKEFDILEYLARHPGEVKTREMILHYAWDTTKVHWSGVVDVHIKRLRDKIDRPFHHPLIKTAYGLGYRLELGRDE